MSRPWLNDDIIRISTSRSKSKSRSRSRSRPRADAKKLKTDQFGRTRSRSRSRNRHRGAARPPGRPRSRSRSRDKSRSSRVSGGRGKGDRVGGRRKRRGSSSSSDGSDSSTASQRSRVVASNKPKYLNARLFVANIVSKDITKDTLSKHFEKYGNVVDILVHPKNYAFIQYLKEEHARLAVEGEHGSTLNGWRLDVKMANENRGSGGGRGGGRGGHGGRPGGPGAGRGWGDRRSHDRDRSPRREPPLDRPTIERGPIDRYDDPYGPPRPTSYPPPPPGDYPLRDPFYPDPYRRFPPDPWIDDPYRRDPFADPYRDPYRVPPAVPGPALPPPVIECEIFLVNSKLRAYGEAIQVRVKDLNIITAVSIIPEGRTSVQMTDELTTRKGLFAIFINAQNEEHRSLTLNILHGTPQEHRNMPLDDAVVLIGRSFQKYVDGLREKAAATAAPPPSQAGARVFLPPSSEVAYLLNLLADNRALTVAELDSIIKYLQERRDKLIDAERRPLITDDNYVKSPSSFVKSSSEQRDSATKDATKLQQELTNKILSIFNGAGGNIQGVPPASSAPSGTPAPPPPPPPASHSSSGANLINFDNPNVQKALDNLIQSSPALLKNIGSGPSPSRQHSGGPMDMSSPGSDSQNNGGPVGPPGPPGPPHGPPQGPYPPQGQYPGYPQQGMPPQGYPMYSQMGYGPY